MTPPRLTLFLDFDGVLHAQGGYEDSDSVDFECAPLLAELLQPWLPQLDIVISSTWGIAHDLDELRRFLPSALADRVSDAVFHHLPLFIETGRREDIDSRWAEIALYREIIRPETGDAWVALDDDDIHWPDPMRDHLAHCPNGLSDPAAQRLLVTALSKWAPAALIGPH